MTAVFTESIIESASLREALLPKLISGEIRVKDAERCLNCRGGSRTPLQKDEPWRT